MTDINWRWKFVWKHPHETRDTDKMIQYYEMCDRQNKPGVEKRNIPTGVIVYPKDVPRFGADDFKKLGVDMDQMIKLKQLDEIRMKKLEKESKQAYVKPIKGVKRRHHPEEFKRQRPRKGGPLDPMNPRNQNFGYGAHAKRGNFNNGGGNFGQRQGGNNFGGWGNFKGNHPTYGGQKDKNWGNNQRQRNHQPQYGGDNYNSGGPNYGFSNMEHFEMGGPGGDYDDYYQHQGPRGGYDGPHQPVYRPPNSYSHPPRGIPPPALSSSSGGSSYGQQHLGAYGSSSGGHMMPQTNHGYYSGGNMQQWPSQPPLPHTQPPPPGEKSKK